MGIVDDELHALHCVCEPINVVILYHMSSVIMCWLVARGC